MVFLSPSVHTTRWLKAPPKIIVLVFLVWSASSLNHIVKLSNVIKNPVALLWGMTCQGLRTVSHMLRTKAFTVYIIYLPHNLLFKNLFLCSVSCFWLCISSGLDFRVVGSSHPGHGGFCFVFILSVYTDLWNSIETAKLTYIMVIFVIKFLISNLYITYEAWSDSKFVSLMLSA